MQFYLSNFQPLTMSCFVCPITNQNVCTVHGHPNLNKIHVAFPQHVFSDQLVFKIEIQESKDAGKDHLKLVSCESNVNLAQILNDTNNSASDFRVSQVETFSQQDISLLNSVLVPNYHSVVYGFAIKESTKSVANPDHGWYPIVSTQWVDIYKVEGTPNVLYIPNVNVSLYLQKLFCQNKRNMIHCKYNKKFNKLEPQIQLHMS